jgi:4-hydroxy-tetrahydrodipicolinate synthase
VREGSMMLSGSMVAVVTPMDADGTVNYRQFAKVIDFHVESGTQFLVVAGTTGESATLDHEEHIDVIAKACELAAGRIPIVAGTGSNSTAQTSRIRISRPSRRRPGNSIASGCSEMRAARTSSC